MSPIDCERVLREVELYLDGELQGAVRVEVESHLGHCGPCMDHSEFRRRVKALVASRCGCDEVPPHLIEQVQVLLRRSSSQEA